MQTRELQDQVAIVTGGASGIGAATVQSLVGAGARVALFDREFAAAETMANSLNAERECVFPVANLLQRVSLPEDVAAVIVFLCMNASRQITAQMLHVSAGAIV